MASCRVFSADDSAAEVAAAPGDAPPELAADVPLLDVPSPANAIAGPPTIQSANTVARAIAQNPFPMSNRFDLRID